jgi:type I restriction enzyme, S subunit
MAGDWPEVRLGNLVSIKHGWPFKSELFSEESSGGPIVVNIGNFRYTGGFRFEETQIKEYRGEYPQEYELSPGDILLVMTCQTSGGEILGIPARVPNDGRTYLHNQRLGKVIVTRPNLVDRGYLYWLFLWSEFNKELALSASGTKILHTAPSRIEAFLFRLPTLPEQRAIAHILGTLDDKIELNRQMNETLEAMARALFKSWFIDFDPVRRNMAQHAKQNQPSPAASRHPLPVGEGRDEGAVEHLDRLFPDSFEDSELGEIPKGWVLGVLYDCAEYINGLAFRNEDFSPDRLGLPVIKIGELKAGITDQTKFTEASFSPKYRVASGDILFSWSGSPDTSIDTFVWAGSEGWLNQHIFKIQFKRLEEKFFVYFLLRHLKPIFIEIARNKQTTGLGHVTAQDLKRLMTILPSDDVLKAFNGLAGPLFYRVHANQLESRILAAIRDSLLPKLISGELGVKNAEKFLEVRA